MILSEPSLRIRDAESAWVHRTFYLDCHNSLTCEEPRLPERSEPPDQVALRSDRSYVARDRCALERPYMDPK